MLGGLLVLIAVDAGLIFFAYYIKHRTWKHHPDVPFGAAVGFAVLAFGVHIVGSWPLAVAVDASTPAGRIVYFICVVLFGLAPAIVFGMLVVEAGSESGTERFMGLRSSTPISSDYSKARALLQRDDIDGALRQYQIYFAEDPSTPQPLFEIAQILSAEHRWLEAADVYRDVIRRFQQQNDIWSKASFRLATILLQELAEKEQAVFILRELARRMSGTDIGIMARQWLMDMEQSEENTLEKRT